DDAGAQMAAGAIDCVQEAVCGSVFTLADKLSAAATSIGIPYFLAGLVMFFGCYVCCVCKKSVPQKDDNVKVVPAAGN
ncbi:MAG: hypothetical protein ACPIOQ_37005, partial [Promethearchaeia archaeon]